MELSRLNARIASLWLALVLTLAALAGCAAPVSSAVSSSVPSSLSKPASSALSAPVSSSQSEPIEQPPRDLPEFNDPNVINTAFTRENCLKSAQYLRHYTILEDAKRLLNYFVRYNYDACKPTVTEISWFNRLFAGAATLGYSTDIMLLETHVRFTCEDAAAGSADLLPTDGDEYGLRLQMIFAEDGDDWRLLGFCTRQSGGISTQVELARFLELEPTYLDLYPHSDRLTTIDLTVQYGISEAVFAEAFDAAHLAVVYYSPTVDDLNYYALSQNPAVAFIDLEAGQIYATAALTDAVKVTDAFVENGELCVVYALDNTWSNLKKARYAADGRALSVEDYSGEKSFVLTQTLAVYGDDVSIWVVNNGKTETLFEGEMTAMTEKRLSYRVGGAPDGHRFIYDKFDYTLVPEEKIYTAEVACYIYDFDTGVSTPLKPEADAVHSPMATHGSLALLAPADPFNDCAYGTVYLADLSGESPALKTVCEDENCYMVWASFSPDGSRLMLRHIREDESGHSTLSSYIEVYDCASGALLLSLDDSAAGRWRCEPQFIDSSHGFVLDISGSCADALIYLLDLS